MSITNITTDQSMGSWAGNGNQNWEAPPADATEGLGTNGDILNVNNGAILTIKGYLNLNAGIVNITEGATVQVVRDESDTAGILQDAAGGTININNGTLSISNDFNGRTGVYNITNGKLVVNHVFTGFEGVYNVNSGGVFVAGLECSNLMSPKINIRGGSVYFYNLIDDISGTAKIDFHNIPGGLLKIENTSLSSLSNLDLHVQNFVYGDQIKIQSYTDYSSNTLTTSISGNDLLIQGTVNGTTTTLVTLKNFVTNTNGNAIPTALYRDGYILFGEQSDTGACFLAGAMIETSKGCVPVEEIQVGDVLVTYIDGQTVTQPVVWAGRQFVVVNSALSDDMAGYPVRVCKNAIAEGVPSKDLLITPEHCLFFEGNFVPVRMLVNGSSVFYDKTITSYTYYHVETEQHSVIMADNVLTESYLDTRSGSSFQQTGKVTRLYGISRTWEKDAAAPLCVDRAVVEPLFRKLEQRAKTLCKDQPVSEMAEQTGDPDLHLVIEAGRTVRPLRYDGTHYSFMLPPHTKSVRIVSRASRPSDVIGPFVDDRRYLGVLVAKIVFVSGSRSYELTSHVQTETPEGWYGAGEEACAWTNGNAVLPLCEHMTQGRLGILLLEVRAGGPYLLSNPKADVRLSQSA